MKTALITGVTGQDGHFLSAHLQSLGYRVVGLVRRVTERENIPPGIDVFDGDLTSVASLIDCVRKYQPDEIYNLAAQSHVATSFATPDMTSMVDYLGLMNLVTAMKTLDYWPKLYQASSSEMYGTGQKDLIDEKTPFNPNSPYAIAKVAAHYYVRSLRAQGLFACAGILFNHESEIRGEDFVTQKIARAAATSEPLILGNVEAKRDWGYAGDYVKAMHLMMQQEEPDEFVVGTGQAHSVKDFIQAASDYTGQPLTWEVSPEFLRPLDVSFLKADASKAYAKLGWLPTVTFEQLVKLMVDNQRSKHANNN